MSEFDRPNISLAVDHFASADEKRIAIVKRVSWVEKPGIVYALARNTCQELVADFTEAGVRTRFYHPSLPARARAQIQDDLITNEAEVIVATISAGVGVDRPNIRFVYHADMGDSLESYYQQLTRGGRDGKAAEALLFYRAGETSSHKLPAGGGRVNAKRLRAVAEAAAVSPGVSAQLLGKPLELSGRQVMRVIRKLRQGGVPTASMDKAIQHHQRNRELIKHRRDQMERYAETTTCRREFLLNYFGEEYCGPCGNCDNCRS